ncbi:MAG: 50S ribosomal protein L3, partial [Planctomycetes bacterium]|nr:50S ribosomal protein L3 [Planctomycetota bacterium]
DGYYAVQIGFDAKDAKHTNKAEAGHVARSGGTAMRYVKELRCAELPKYKQGDDLTVALFEGIKHVDITGLTKGLGHAGTIRRFGFHRQAQSHGNSKAHRKVGGTGRTYATAKGMPKGKRMAGRKGVDRVTMQNLEVVKIDAERNLLFVKGSIPGKPSGYLIVRKAAKKA